MYPIQLGERAVQALVAAGARAPAFDPAAIEFADGVHVRQMRDAPGAAPGPIVRAVRQVRPAPGCGANSSRSCGCAMVASAIAQTRAATARYPATSTTVLARATT